VPRVTILLVPAHEKFDVASRPVNWFEECCRRWMCTARERGAVQEPGVDEVDCVDEAAVLEHWPPGFRCAVIRVMGLA
jgi:hypothetical protein